MIDQPLVSIAIPAYNHASFIEACLSSVCAQTYSELELVLIDDGSTDATFEIAERFLALHSRRFVRIVLERKKNQGVSANSNACIAACKGEWVHLLGSDDVIRPNKVERIQQFIEDWNCENLALVHADCDYIGENGEEVVRQKQKSRPSPGPDFYAYRWLFSGQHYVFNPTVTLHRDRFLAIGGFDKNLPLEDLDCWLRLAAKHPIARVPEVLASYRKHPGNSLRRRVRMLGALFQTYGKFLSANSDLICASEVRAHFRRNVWRFWKRIRKHDPFLLYPTLTSVASTYVRTPLPEDYFRFSEYLKRATPR